MATIIKLNQATTTSNQAMPEGLKALLDERKRAKRQPLTVEKLRQTKGLENLSDTEAEEAVDTIKRLAAIFFEMACQNENTCIDNQQVVSLNPQSKAA